MWSRGFPPSHPSSLNLCPRYSNAMTSKIIILIITALFIAWELCRSKQTDKTKIRKTDSLFTIISLVICITLTVLKTCIHLTDHLWFLLLPAIAISLMCTYSGRKKKHEPVQGFSVVEKGVLVTVVVLLCSGVADCSYLYPSNRFTCFFMASMFYKMLGGWILAELIFCRQFQVVLVKTFFLTVLAVNIVRFIGVVWLHSIYHDALYPLIQVAISLAALVYMFCKFPCDKNIKRS